eukprot:COSAG01_NODE_9559_length_2409_cov_63.678788_3_plen_76_part_00
MERSGGGGVVAVGGWLLRPAAGTQRSVEGMEHQTVGPEAWGPQELAAWLSNTLELPAVGARVVRGSIVLACADAL